MNKRRILIQIGALTILIGALLRPSVALAYLAGDANGDGLLNMGDIIKMERIILGLEPYNVRADTDGNEIVDMGDVVKVERIILGMDPVVRR